ncbi:MAG: amidohydrolase [Bacteroidota bacterium]
MNKLRVTLVQSDIIWERIDENLSNFAQRITLLANQTDIIILPEMFTTGFSMNPASVAEKMNGKTMEWLAHQAKAAAAVVTGSFVAEENGAYFNRLVWMQPDGKYYSYDKKHLFTLAKENEYYQAGTERLVVEWKGWKICPLICYDLRFPVWSRNNVGYDLLIYIASWPTPRTNAWQTLLAGRAIENQAYTIGVNRVGEDNNKLNYSGASSVIDYSGKTIYSAVEQEAIFTATLDYEKQRHFRTKLNFLADQDAFQLI